MQPSVRKWSFALSKGPIVVISLAFAALRCGAGQATFSNDGQTIYIPSIEHGECPLMREINLTDQTSRTFQLPDLPQSNYSVDVAATCDDRVLCSVPDSLWAYDPKTHTVSKIRDAPDGAPFAFVAYDPKTHANFVTTDGKYALLKFARPDAEPTSIFVRRHSRITAPVFTSRGEVLYGYGGDVWLGEIQEDSLGRGPTVAAFRIAPLATFETDDTSPAESGAQNLAVSRNFIYTHIYRMGGSGWGWLTRFNRTHAKRDSHGALDVMSLPDERFEIYRQALDSVRVLRENDHLSFLCNSPDETTVYYYETGKDWLIRNGRLTRLHLREEKP